MKPSFIFTVAISIVLQISTVHASSMNELGARLGSPNYAERLAAVREIAIEYPQEGLKLLLQAAADPDEFVRERAVQALGLADSGQAVGALKKALKDPDAFVRWRAVQSLARLGVHDIAQELGSLIADPSWHVKVSALELLGTIGAEQLKRKGPEIKGNLDEPVRQPLLRGLADSDERVKVAAASALARNRDDAAFGPLVELVRDGSMYVRDQAALALGDLGDIRAVRGGHGLGPLGRGQGSAETDRRGLPYRCAEVARLAEQP